MKVSATECAVEIERREETEMMIDMVELYLENYQVSDREREMLIKLKNELLMLDYLW